MVYGALPPEVNSGRMYAGPGAGSMLTAAAAWDELAVELRVTATAFESVITDLVSGPFLGAAATAMVAAATPYAAWLDATAAQAEATAGQAKAAVAAYETAYAMTVHPAQVAANRAQLATLVATNYLGQNMPAIALAETRYGEMWAQDAAAMYGYAAASAAAARLTPFAEPPQVVNPAGVASQTTGAVAAAGSVVTVLTQLGSIGDTVLPGWITDLDTLMSIFGTPFFVCTSSAGLMMSMMSTINGLFPAVAGVGGQIAASVGSAAANALGAVSASSVGAAGSVSAALGEASSVGALSVPRAWAASAPTLSHAAVGALPGTVSGVAPLMGSAAPELLGGLPVGAGSGRAQAAGVAIQDGIAPLRVLPSLVG